MAVPVARAHLKVAHAALPALLPTPPTWKMLTRMLPTPYVAAVLPKPAPAKPSRADTDERWDARKTKPACTEPRASSSSPRKNASSPPPPKPGRADSVERCDAHKKAQIPASSSSLTSSRVSSAERWDVHRKRRPPQAESSSTGSNDIDELEEEILWKPRAMYAGPGFAVAAPQPSMLPMPASFLVRVA